MDEQESLHRQRVQQFPQSPLTHYALGRYLLEKGRYEEAIPSLAEANRLQPEYVAAMVALGDAQRGAGRTSEAKSTFESAHQVAVSQKHLGFAEEIEERISEL